MSTILLPLVAATLFGATIPAKTVERHNEMFQRFWGTDFVWKFEDLPAVGKVPDYRVPYSGHIYLDRNGGTMNSLRKYDMAFHGGRMLATAHEQWDTSAFQEPVATRGGLFGRRQVMRMGTPNWHGHCNGWAAAAIRHAEPQQSVTRNGVVFSPADIKGLLAELYIYNDIADVSGSSGIIQAGLFHAVVANWLGRGSHPLGMEADPGREKWNYPAYSFTSTSRKYSERYVEVSLNLTFAHESRGEYQRSPRNARVKYFHYRLDLNPAGEIVGGDFYGGSSRIDMLWVPLLPKAPGEPGHERGNPHIKVENILAIWRDSVPEETRKQWLAVDPAAEDRVADATATASLVPLQNPKPVQAAAVPAEKAKTEPSEAGTQPARASGGSPPATAATGAAGN